MEGSTGGGGGSLSDVSFMEVVEPTVHKKCGDEEAGGGAELLLHAYLSPPMLTSGSVGILSSFRLFEGLKSERTTSKMSRAVQHVPYSTIFMLLVPDQSRNSSVMWNKTRGRKQIRQKQHTMK